MERDDLEERRQLFRNDLIAPVLHRDLAHGEQAAILREQAQQEWEVPGGGRRTISARTLRRYLHKRRAQGLAGLRRRRRSDAGARKRLSDAAWERAQALRREQPRRSAEVILEMLVHEKLLERGQCHPATMRRHLRAAGLNRKALLRERPKAYRRWQRREPGALWQFDATGGLWLPAPDDGPPRQLWTIAGKDDASRLLVGARAYHHAHQAALDDLCKRAFRRWGIPRAIYVDRGSIFMSRHFHQVCGELGVELIHASAYYAEGKGKIESAMALLKDSLYPELQGDIAGGRITTCDQVNAALEAWSHYVNHRRHRETKQVPADVYGPEPRHPYPDPLAFDQLFLWRRRATVDKFGTVPLEGNRYAAGADLRGQRVELRYDPFDLAKVQLWVKGAFRAELAPEALVERVAEPVRGDPQPPETRATGTSFLAVLREQYEADLRRQAEDIPFRRVPAPTGPQIGALVARLEDLLGRALRPAEQHQLAAAWRTRGPLPADAAADRLRPHLARLGRHSPLTAILPLLWGEPPCSPGSSD
jgi:putative transposase